MFCTMVIVFISHLIFPLSIIPVFNTVMNVVDKNCCEFCSYVYAIIMLLPVRMLKIHSMKAYQESSI